MLNRDIEFLLSPTEGKRRGDPPAHHRTSMNFFRFPTWLSCSHCNLLKQHGLELADTPKCNSPIRISDGDGKTCASIPPKFQKVMEPVRFLIACEQGHIDDFPWSSWVHRGKPCSREKEALFIRSTGRDGLEGVEVLCHCGERRTMRGAFDSDELKKHLPDGKCTGRKPWLGSEFQSEECDCQNVRTVQRGSSGIYFPNIMSSILIPPYSRTIMLYFAKGKNDEAIRTQILPFCNKVGDEIRIPEEKSHVLSFMASQAGFDSEDFIQNFKAKYCGEPEAHHATDLNDEAFRFREFEAFQGERPPKEERREFDINPVPLKKYDEWVSEYFSRIVRVEQLKETRAFTGFSRIKPTVPGPSSIAKIYERAANWLPAIEVRGEGIFFEFNLEPVQAWALRRKKIGLAKRMQAVIDQKIASSQPNLSRRENVDEAFLLVHSFAHALIYQLAFECGYDASSLKERLFVGTNEGKQMCGVLIYTASGDSEGSLGGLVERAKPGHLEHSIIGAISHNVLCSNDPICMETGIDQTNRLNGASCHACNMLPETSCEHGNWLLDRSALTGTLEEPDLGYFHELLD